MTSITRRSLLGGAAMAAAASALGSVRLPTTRAMDPIRRTRPSHLKLSIAAYSYRQFLSGDSPTMDLFDFADLAADMALDAIEPTSYYFPSDVSGEMLRNLRRHAFLRGLDISGTAIGNDFCVAPGPDREAQLALTRTWIDRAAVLNAPMIRVFAGRTPRGESEEVAVARAIEGFKEVLPYAAEKGVFLALENHGGITATSDQMMTLIEAIDHPYFAVNLDTGNFRTEDPYGDLARIAPYAVNVQVKTEISRNGESKEEADLPRLIQILRDVKYSGYVVLEYEAAEDPMTAIPRHVKRLRELMA
ncbi:sugar phosphate isomerase/epimerase family protein [Tautonia rosea]|uniref:sugar phosphate isomerase/epimerase family protein n=1 Tax=Tautonia rosea TaxID=2728037 RepID=UPI001473A3BB|nr:sugar phosphate isomerase/epimerase family protein [Tautonia rosea]